MTTYKIMFKYGILFLFLAVSAQAGNYFVHLSPTAREQRANLLAGQLEGVMQKGLPDTSFHFDEIEMHLKEKPGLGGWLMLSGSSAQQVAARLSDAGTVDAFEPVGYFKLNVSGNDSLIGRQWFLDKINVDAAWAHTQGDPSIIVGVIDTGVDYKHDDLRAGLWINPAEDINHNGRLDPGDNNGIDDDGNGYIDDVIGWDFTDAPRFADGGDYKDPDNDPMDEFGSGHGTQVAGIISAQNNNTSGGSGIAPGCRVMVLRAGTASGYLEEDDVARAILYALDNGVRVLNMSFGDVVLSRFLKDVIHYAADKGMVMVASSGNSGDDNVHFPSGLPETISVGASTSDDGLAGFSSYGNTLDLVAPGRNILSTAIGNGYNTVDGTSFSAPMVSAAAALLLSKNPLATPNEIRSLLKTSATDILTQGWDIFSAAGRLDIGRAMDVPYGGNLAFERPLQGESFAGDSLKVMITAQHPQLLQITLAIGVGKNPTEFVVVGGPRDRQYLHETIRTIPLNTYPDTTLTLRLIMELTNGANEQTRVTFHKDQTPPRISDVNLIPLIDGPDNAMLITFHTDDICTAHLKIRKTSDAGDFLPVGDSYETQNHRFKLDRSDFDGDFAFFIEARNLGGLTSEDNNQGALYHFTLHSSDETLGLQQVEWSLPAGYMLSKATDLDHDGHKEIIISRYDEKSAFGPIEIYEFENGIFQLKLRTGFKAIPRDAGDVDGDGKSDLLLGFGQYSFLFESSAPDSFPTQLIWQDSSGFWAAAYTDGDNDGIKEIAGYKDNAYRLLESRSSNRFTEISVLENPTQGANRLGVPKIQTIDFDGDGKKELVYGDYDGDLIAYVGVGDNTLALKATGHTWHDNATELFTSDGNELITATHTSKNQNFEHEFDARFWSIESHGLKQNKLLSLDTSNTFGYASTRDFDSGLIFSRLDSMSLLFATFFPNLYLFKRKSYGWQPVFSDANARSNTVVVADMDDDGFDEFYYNNSNAIVGYGLQRGDRPAPPRLLTSEMLDSVTVSLSWQGAAPGYHIYRGRKANELSDYARTDQHYFTDTLSLVGQKYYYRVIAVDSAFVLTNSYFSNLDSVTGATPPRLVDIRFQNDRQCLLRFDQKLSLSPRHKPNVIRQSDAEQASSLLIGSRKFSLLATFSIPFTPGLGDTLIFSNLYGETGVPVIPSDKRVPIRYSVSPGAPYVQKRSWIADRTLRVDFSQPMTVSELTSPAYYSLEPAGDIAGLVLVDGSQKSVQVSFKGNVPLGGSGIPVYLRISGLHSALGTAMEDDELLSLNRKENGLVDLFIYPQPVKPGDDKLVFAHIDGPVTITIYNLAGHKIKTLQGVPEYGGISWDLTTDRHQKIESGVYLYDVRNDKSNKQGKIVLVR